MDSLMGARPAVSFSSIFAYIDIIGPVTPQPPRSGPLPWRCLADSRPRQAVAAEHSKYTDARARRHPNHLRREEKGAAAKAWAAGRASEARANTTTSMSRRMLQHSLQAVVQELVQHRLSRVFPQLYATRAWRIFANFAATSMSEMIG
jgi:hypothetical protein